MTKFSIAEIARRQLADYDAPGRGAFSRMPRSRLPMPWRMRCSAKWPRGAPLAAKQLPGTKLDASAKRCSGS